MKHRLACARALAAALVLVPCGALATFTASVSTEKGEIRLSWSGGSGPFYLVESSSDLETWSPVSGLLDAAQTSFTLVLGELEKRAFFRVAEVNPSPTARYRVTFTSLWSRETFVTVPNNEHFTSPIGGTHGDGVSFWEPSGIATDGIERMAESGAINPLGDEVEDAIDGGTAENLVLGIGGPHASGDTSTFEFDVGLEFPLVTIVSMIAPSPDWFVGVHGESLLSPAGAWFETLEFDLLPYDAGTDSGATFTASNSDVTPHEPIASLVEDPAFSLVEPSETPVPMARFLFERIDE